MACPVCHGSGVLLCQTCPLCDGDSDNDEDDEMDDGLVSNRTSPPVFWCGSCQKDLQSAECFEQHLQGRRHLSRIGNKAKRSPASEIDENAFFENLASGCYRRIVICTGAGVSTAAGIPDFRSANGLFDILNAKLGQRYPELPSPELLLSRSFREEHPDVWETEVHPLMTQCCGDSLVPTTTHEFCSWLFHQGWLTRVYTQNIDGLHTHPALGIPCDLVVQCHGSIRDDNLVLYGDPIPRRFFACCDADFGPSAPAVDLVLVMGTSLQVAPFCAIPNLAPRGCTRVLVNSNLQDCCDNKVARDVGGGFGRMQATTQIGQRKYVQLRSLWWDRKAKYRWPQLRVESRCDEFVDRFYDHLREAMR